MKPRDIWADTYIKMCNGGAPHEVAEWVADAAVQRFTAEQEE